MNEELDFSLMDKALEEKKAEIGKIEFEKSKEKEVKNIPTKDELIDSAFNSAVVHTIKNDNDLQTNVLDTAKTYTKTKMQAIATKVDTEYKEAVFNNKKDACESYGFNEKTTPIWAVKVMSFFYSIMLAIWLLIGSFTFMPVIFVAKKIQVGLKKTWLAIIVSLLLYFGVTIGIPILTNFIRGKL